MRTMHATRILVLCFYFFLASNSLAQTSERAQLQGLEFAIQHLVGLSNEIETTALDCSHFVNQLFEESGLTYNYTPSHVLYRGKTDAFRRVYRPAAGDLVVWPGHVGIVVDPEEKTFVSALRRGVRISSYISSYWRQRGVPRFMRYRLPVNNPQLVWDIREPRPGQNVDNWGVE